ncbi:Transcriptional regulator NRG1 [Lachnellula suecica]|uniref:C2H2 type master regulator of conidiophore development brlA n=1 Tax=Lachnellula suecica TaxID=602035 RepID=A0A8T9C3L8_9HELO|nr:Transcriptional regulator NRG1 [Lachnellula suecica]
MFERPSMPARDSSGRHISLLNDEPAHLQKTAQYHPQQPYGAPEMMRSDSTQSSAASPATPGLTRSESYDSQNTEPRSPITPTSSSLDASRRPTSYMNAGRPFKDPMQQQQPQYDQRMQFEYSSQQQYHLAPTQAYGDGRQMAYPQSHGYEEEEPYTNRSALSPHIGERGTKRYPCRFANDFNCDKTFTTSGHASRHSKIHTAEKAVQCSYEGCPKKFTRNDNMKQHLETHFKDKSRSPTGVRPLSGSDHLAVLTKPAGIRKSGHHSRQTSRSSSVAEASPLDPALRNFVQHNPATGSPRSPLNMGPGFQKALESRLVAARNESGLDALAAVAAGFQARS